MELPFELLLYADSYVSKILATCFLTKNYRSTSEHVNR
jgi:hypothetical protein